MEGGGGSVLDLEGGGKGRGGRGPERLQQRNGGSILITLNQPSNGNQRKALSWPRGLFKRN